MTFGKFSLFVILPSSLLVSLLVVLVGIKVFPGLTDPVTVFVEKEGLRLTSDVPQTGFDDGVKFYLTGDDIEAVDVTGMIYFYTFITYLILCYLLLTIVFYLFYRTKKINHFNEK